MCQRNNIQKRFAAGTICYKVLRSSSEYGYLSMYQRKPWILGQIHKTVFYNYELSSDIIKEYCSSFGSIGFGFFHAFSALKEAKRFQKFLLVESFSSTLFNRVITDYPIAKMRIPEDVDGFSGTFCSGGEYFESITVPILEFVKIIDQNVSDK